MLGKLGVDEIAVGEVVIGEISLGKLRWGNDLTPKLIISIFLPIHQSIYVFLMMKQTKS